MVEKLLLSVRVPTILPSIRKINDCPAVAVKVTVSLSHIATVLGAIIPPTCKPEIGASLTVICIILLNSSQILFCPEVLMATLLKKVVVVSADVGVYTAVVIGGTKSAKGSPNLLACQL